jgi:hypothetical protein
MPESDVSLANQLVERLDRLSADSLWAHRACGVKGSLLRCLQDIQSTSPNNPPSDDQTQRLRRLITHGFDILGKAAAQIETIDSLSDFPRRNRNHSP